MTEAVNTSSYSVSVERIPKLFPGISWHPSRETWERAKVLYEDVDLGKIVVEYVQKNRTKAAPSEDQWLSWCAQAQRRHDEAVLRIKAEQQAQDRPKRWYDVAE